MALNDCLSLRARAGSNPLLTLATNESGPLTACPVQRFVRQERSVIVVDFNAAMPFWCCNSDTARYNFSTSTQRQTTKQNDAS